MLEDIYIPDLIKSQNKTRKIEFREFFEELETLSPIQGWVTIRHGGTFLEVKVAANGIITLTCDRSLEKFNYRLTIDTNDIVMLADKTSYQKEQEILVEDLTESFLPNGTFPLKFWIYEQLCLAIPYPAIAPDAPSWQSVAVEQDIIDNRWAGLKNLKLPD